MEKGKIYDDGKIVVFTGRSAVERGVRRNKFKIVRVAQCWRDLYARCSKSVPKEEFKRDIYFGLDSNGIEFT